MGSVYDHVCVVRSVDTHTCPPLLLWLGEAAGRWEMRATRCLDKHKDSSSFVNTILNQLFTIRGLFSCDRGCFVYSAQAAQIVNMFFLSPPFKRINKKAAVRRFNSETPLSGALRYVKKPIAKSLQLAEYAFILGPKAPWTIKLSLTLNKTIIPDQSGFIIAQIISTASLLHACKVINNHTCTLSAHNDRENRSLFWDIL